MGPQAVHNVKLDTSIHHQKRITVQAALHRHKRDLRMVLGQLMAYGTPMTLMTGMKVMCGIGPATASTRALRL